MSDFGKKFVAALEGITERLNPFNLQEFGHDENAWFNASDLSINGALYGKEFGLAFIQEGLRIMEHQPGDYVGKVQAFAVAMGAPTVDKMVAAVRYRGAIVSEAPKGIGSIAVTRMGHPCVVIGDVYIPPRGIRSFRAIEAITGPNGERQGSTIRHHTRRVQDIRYFVSLCGVVKV